MTDVDGLLRNSNHALDAAHNATDYTTDDAANHRADRTGGALTHGDAKKEGQRRR